MQKKSDHNAQYQRRSSGWFGYRDYGQQDCQKDEITGFVENIETV